MSDTSLMYWSQKLGKTQARKLQFTYEITGAKASSEIVPGYPALVTYDALSSQDQIDSFLDDNANEFLLAQFDATSRGDDAFGGIINTAQQIEKALWMEARCYSGTGGSTLVERAVKASSTLSSSTLATEYAKSASGYLGFKIDFGNTPDFDALTSGLIIVDMYYLSK